MSTKPPNRESSPEAPPAPRSVPRTLAPPASVPRPRPSVPPPGPPRAPPSKPPPLPNARPLASLGDDDDEDEITIVGRMSDDLKALRQGYRKAPSAAVDSDRPEIEVTSDGELDLLLVEELLEDAPAGTRPLISLEVCGDTHVGRRRKINEDRLLVLRDREVYAVADGMGGHASGEVAAELALEVVERALRDRAFSSEPNLFWPSDGDELARSIEEANRAVFEASTSDARLDGMGTTLTAIRFSRVRNRAYIAHVGDSPCFRLRRGVIVQLTRDHTMANLVGMVGPMANHLSRAVGVEPLVEVDLTVDVPEDGDAYLVCSDGLTKMLKPHEIAALVGIKAELATTVQALIDEANERGGRDNIAVLLVRVQRLS